VRQLFPFLRTNSIQKRHFELTLNFVSNKLLKTT
jgi:hypothetical protein